MLRRIDRPVAWTRWTACTTCESVPWGIPVDLGCRKKGPNLEMEMAGSTTVCPSQNNAKRLSALHDISHPHSQHVVEMAVHRKQIIRMPHDDDQTGVFRSSENHLPSGRG